MPGISWLPWSAASFARARSERKPVLLSITARWSIACAAMERTTYTDPSLAQIVRARAVPIRVDADRRPDVSHRYALDALPTTVFLTADGDVIGGGTWIEAERLASVLQQVADAYARGLPPAPARSGQSQVRARADPDVLRENVFSAFDPAHGGFGGAPKVPVVAPVRFALRYAHATGSTQARGIAVATLDAMGWGPLSDARGAFYRMSRRDDWSDPSREVLLDVNAQLAGLYAEAFAILGGSRYADRLDGVLRFVEERFATEAGGWSACEVAADPMDRVAGPVDRTLYTDSNARMASAALAAGRILDRPALSEVAIRTLERLVLSAYRPGHGVAHVAAADDEETLQVGRGPRVDAGRARGLLDDHVFLADALLDAFDATGNVVYRMMAEETIRHALRVLWDETDGGFYDRETGADDLGLLKRRFKPFATNCVAASVLGRLAAGTGDSLYAERVARTLEAIGPRAAAEGVAAAEYLLALGDAGAAVIDS